MKEIIKDIIYITKMREWDRVWYWLHTRNLLTGKRFSLTESIRAAVSNPRGFEQFYDGSLERKQNE